MNKIFEWIKANVLSSVLIVVLVVILFGKGILLLLTSTIGMSPVAQKRVSTVNYSDAMYESVGAPVSGRGGYSNYYQVAPQPDITDRKMITNSYMALLVKNVTNTMGDIKVKTMGLKGYVVSENINREPEYGDETGTIVVRVPVEVVDTFKLYLREISAKVVAENIQGTDITDEYVDIQDRITRLQKTLDRLETIMEQTENVEEIMQVLSQIQNVQNQIDSYKGQLKYMEGASDTSLITINLSTDELSLPYTPAKSWRPSVVFKKAVRSMLTTLQNLGSLAIWAAVYIPVILIMVAVFKVIKVIFRKRQKPQA